MPIINLDTSEVPGWVKDKIAKDNYVPAILDRAIPTPEQVESVKMVSPDITDPEVPEHFRSVFRYWEEHGKLPGE